MSDRVSDDGRVALDVGAARYPATGVSIYIVELTRALEAVAPERFVRIGARPDGPLGVGSVADAGPNPRGRLYLSWLLRHADRDARRAGCGLVHYTNAMAPIRPRVPFVLTIQDLSLIRMARSHTRARLAAIPIMVAAAHAARLVIVPSEATRHELRRLLRVPDRLIVTIPLAARTPAEEAPDRRVLDTLGLGSDPYILSIGTIEPRKNHQRLLAAFERVATTDPRLRLVITGAPGWHGDGFRQALATSRVRDRVVETGHRSDADLASLLGRCAVMAYPSLYEGFGLPIVEAMAVGVPVVTSKISSMPEAAGGAAVLVDPYDIGSIAAGLAEALGRREELSAAGRARVAGRTWLDVARETLEVYRRAV